ncbi:aspartate/glutamate racemase family protein [Roseibium sp. MMSF_3412]|uniref:aspartate/glutamate racemase family protein n=1 Tax=Roseibium sp. MMSF_3412 TaxID=3046712 RepID=UPI00273CF598|nr:aspartate/glutamate racemase family protein [Roseibium sp. MMSF_3412]
MHIGLIGGIGSAATDFYYRRLISLAAEKRRDLDLTIAHADAPTLLANLTADNGAAQCEIYLRLTERLKAAGAEKVAVTSIAGHFCIDAFAEISPLPILDLTTSLAVWLRDKGMTRVGILGTETVMRSGMYGKLAPVDVLAPAGDDLKQVHEAYVALVQSDVPSRDLKDVFVRTGRALVERGAEAVLLGGTDLNAVFTAKETAFPVIDCAGIHAEDIARFI